jgi:hypothetical protein
MIMAAKGAWTHEIADWHQESTSRWGWIGIEPRTRGIMIDLSGSLPLTVNLLCCFGFGVIAGQDACHWLWSFRVHFMRKPCYRS